jgi:hypothetical protein
MVWDSESEPAAMGIFRWRIILPRFADQRLAKEDLNAMLAHELAHLVRGDPMWHWVGRLLCSVAAFQPLNLVAWRQWRRAAEFQCDTWAVEAGVARLALARCLTRIAEWRHSHPLPEPALASSGAPGDLTDRVERLLEESPTPPKNKPLSRVARAGLVAVAVAILCIVLPGMQISGKPPSEQPAGLDSEQPPTDSAEGADDRETAADAVVHEIRVLDDEIRALRAATRELQTRLKNSTVPPSDQKLPERVLSRLDTIELLRNDLVHLAQRLANERKER